MRKKLRSLVTEYSERNKDGNCTDVYSVTNSQGFVPSTDYFSKEVFSKDLSTYKVVRNGMIAYNPSRINVGSIAVQRAEDRVIVSPLYVVFSVNETELLPEFLSYYLHSDAGLQQIASHTSGSVRDSLKFTALQDMEINLYSVERQREIIKKLQKLESAIQKTQLVLKKFDELIQSQFAMEFGDPVTNPKGWKTLPLKEIGVCKNGMNFGANEFGVMVKYVGVGDIKDLSNIDDVGMLSSLALNRMPEDDYLLQDEDIIFVRSNGNKNLVGRCVVVYPKTTPTTFSGFCIRFRKKTDSLQIKYLLCFLKQSSVRQMLTGRGANIQNLNQKILMELSVPIPPIELQNNFTAFVEKTESAKAKTEKNLAQFETCYKALLQQYFG